MQEPMPTHDPSASSSAPQAARPSRATRLGCGWLTLLVLWGAVGLVVGGLWLAREASMRQSARELSMSFDDVSLLPNTSVKSEDPEYVLQLLYIAQGRALTSLTRKMTRPAEGVAKVHLVAQELTRPADSPLLVSPLPKGVSILAVYVVDGIVWVDLSAEFKQVEGVSPLLERLTIYGMVNSFLLNDTTLRGVRFLIDGQPCQTAWGWLDLSSPLGPDLSLVR